ncbi:hypothetical protein GCM10027299_29220 [Larkinella ripae]
MLDVIVGNELLGQVEIAQANDAPVKIPDDGFMEFNGLHVAGVPGLYPESAKVRSCGPGEKRMERGLRVNLKRAGRLLPVFGRNAGCNGAV